MSPGVQLGLYGAAIRQHMRKIFLIFFFKYCNTQVHQSKSHGLGRSTKSGQHQKKGLKFEYKGPGFFWRTSGALEGQNHWTLSSLQEFSWKQPAVNELGRGSQATVCQRSHLIRSRSSLSSLAARLPDTRPDCNMMPMKDGTPEVSGENNRANIPCFPVRKQRVLSGTIWPHSMGGNKYRQLEC